MFINKNLSIDGDYQQLVDDIEMTVEEPLSDDKDGVPHGVSDSESESDKDSD